MTLWFELKASRIISVPTRTCHLSSETLESPVLPHPPDPRTRTHAHTRDHKCNFSITFFSPRPPPLYRLRLILTDLRLKEETRIHIRSVSFKERAQARQLLPPHPLPQTRDVSWRRNLTSSRLERANAARCQSAQLASGRTFLQARVQ